MLWKNWVHVYQRKTWRRLLQRLWTSQLCTCKSITCNSSIQLHVHVHTLWQWWVPQPVYITCKSKTSQVQAHHTIHETCIGLTCNCCIQKQYACVQCCTCTNTIACRCTCTCIVWVFTIDKDMLCTHCHYKHIGDSSHALYMNPWCGVCFLLIETYCKQCFKKKWGFLCLRKQ